MALRVDPDILAEKKRLGLEERKQINAGLSEEGEKVMAREKPKRKLKPGEIVIIDNHDCAGLKEINGNRSMDNSYYDYAVYKRSAVCKESFYCYNRDAVRAKDIDGSMERWVLQIGIVSWFGSSGNKFFIKFCPFCGEKLE